MQKTKLTNIDKYFLPLGLLSGLYALSFSFIFFIEGVKQLAITMSITSALTLILVTAAIKMKKEQKHLFQLSYFGIFHLGFLYGAYISGGLYSPMIWGQLMISPMAYKFLEKKKHAHILSAIVFSNICFLFLIQSGFYLPINQFNGPPNPSIQFLAIVPLFIFFPLHSLLTTSINDEIVEEKNKQQYPMAN